MSTSTMLVKEEKLEDKELTDPITEVAEEAEEEEVDEVETEPIDHQEETEQNKHQPKSLLKLQSKKLENGIDHSHQFKLLFLDRKAINH